MNHELDLDECPRCGDPVDGAARITEPFQLKKENQVHERVCVIPSNVDGTAGALIGFHGPPPDDFPTLEDLEDDDDADRDQDDDASDISLEDVDALNPGERRIVKVVREHGPLSAAQIMGKTAQGDVTPDMIEDAIQGLETRGFLQEAGADAFDEPAYAVADSLAI